MSVPKIAGVLAVWGSALVFENGVLQHNDGRFVQMCWMLPAAALALLAIDAARGRVSNSIGAVVGAVTGATVVVLLSLLGTMTPVAAGVVLLVCTDGGRRWPS